MLISPHLPYFCRTSNADIQTYPAEFNKYRRDQRLDTSIPLVPTGSVSRRITGRGALATEMPGHILVFVQGEHTKLVILSTNVEQLLPMVLP